MYLSRICSFDLSLGHLFMCAACHTVQITAAGQTCLMLQTHSAISTSLTGNRSSYWNLKPTLQPPRVRPYSIAPVQKKNDTPQAHVQTGHLSPELTRKKAVQFCSYQNVLVPSAAIRLLPRNIHAHSRGG